MQFAPESHQRLCEKADARTSGHEPNAKIPILHHASICAPATNRVQCGPTDQSCTREHLVAAQFLGECEPPRLGETWHLTTIRIDCDQASVMDVDIRAVRKIGELSFKFLRQPCVIGIEEGDPIGTGRLNSSLASCTGPPICPAVDDSHSRIERRQDLVTVRRCVVDHDNLERANGLAQHRCHGRTHVGVISVEWDDHSHGLPRSR